MDWLSWNTYCANINDYLILLLPSVFWGMYGNDRICYTYLMSKIRSAVVAIAIIQCVARAHEWEDPLVNELGRLPARPVAVPCDTRARAERIANLEAERTSSPYVLSLNGEWDFEWKARPDTNEVRRGTIAVPGCWQLQGDYDPPIYTNVRYPHAKDPPRIMTPFCSSSSLRRLNMASARPCFSRRWRKRRRVVASGALSEATLRP